MSTEELIRGFCASIAALTLAWVIWDRSDAEVSPLSEDDHPRPRYASYIPNNLLPIILCLFPIVGFVTKDAALTLEVLLSACFGIFLHICLHYLLLMLFIPLFRKFISARACATLWLLPNYLYFTLHSSMGLDRPALVLTVSKTVLVNALHIWLVGFCAVMGWRIISHLRFRRMLLKDAVPVTDPAVLDLWQQEQQAAGYRKMPYRLVTSPVAATPLSIGFFKRTIRVVLPERGYALDGLALIFRHELVHIGREDSGTKFFLAFCTAMCWFNPLMWLAMRHSADDLELSCDETVLLDANEAARKQYAHLLLHTAGDERGFTTCLSASARALRYRMKNVVMPRKRFSGALAVSLVFFLLTISSGYVTLAYGAGNGSDLIFDGQDPVLCTIENINYDTPEGCVYATCPDPGALYAYMEALEFHTLTGSYSFSNDEYAICLILHGPKGAFGVTMTDHTLKVTPLYDDSPPKTSYYIQAPIDWAYIESLLVFDGG